MIQTLDVQWSEYAQEQHPPLEPHSVCVWGACRRGCADLCIQRGLIGMAREIMKDEDGSVDKEWWESHMDDEFCGSY